MDIKTLKEISNTLQELGFRKNDALQIVGTINRENPELLPDILKGDFSHVQKIAEQLKICSPVTLIKNTGEQKTPPGVRKSERTCSKIPTVQGEIIPQKIAGEIVPKIDGEIITDSLPNDIEELLTEWLHDTATKHHIDLDKCSNIQWRSICLEIGQHIQKTRILEDIERERTHGGKLYHPDKILQLVSIWERLTGFYKHIPLAGDFIAFSGVSESWYRGNNGNSELTSTRAGIVQKVRGIEEKALAAALTDSRENPTGRIYYTKARLGWRETTEIIHTSAKETQQAASLPVFDGVGGLLDG